MPKYCIHEHWASHHHFDLRLAMEGVAKSWAVPKEPPKVEGVKRLAIQVDDHSIKYMNFEGQIKEGHYGAGKVKIWDSGTYKLLERTPNKILMNLNGRKLKGLYELVRFRQSGEKNWLFFKKKKASS